MKANEHYLVRSTNTSQLDTPGKCCQTWYIQVRGDKWNYAQSPRQINGSRGWHSVISDNAPEYIRLREEGCQSSRCLHTVNIPASWTCFPILLFCFSDKRSLICTCSSSVCTTRSTTMTTRRSNVYGYNKLFTFILPSGSCIIDLCSFECNELEHKCRLRNAYRLGKIRPRTNLNTHMSNTYR